MKRCILSLFLIVVLILSSKSQCNIYVQMVPGVEGCLFPVIVSTQQMLYPCSAPAPFYQLVAGDFAYIDFTPGSCGSFCMAGTMVDITCFNSVVGIDESKEKTGITVYPNPAIQTLYVEGFTTTFKAEVCDIFGNRILIKQVNNTSIDINHLANGLYFIKLQSEEGSVVKKFVKN